MTSFDNGEHQANDPIISHHHIHIPRGSDGKKIVNRIEREIMKSLDDDEMREIEPGQTFPLYNFLR